MSGDPGGVSDFCYLFLFCHCIHIIYRLQLALQDAVMLSEEVVLLISILCIISCLLWLWLWYKTSVLSLS